MIRQDQRQMWVSAKFLEKLEEIRAKRALLKKPVRGMPDLTAEIMQTNAMKIMEDELLKSGTKKKERFIMKMDGSFS